MLLAGPLLRRVDAGRVCVWLATSEPVSSRLIVYRFAAGETEAIGDGVGEGVRLGQRLWVHLLQATPHDGAWPPDELLAYDVELRAEGDQAPRTLATLGLLDRDDRITYGDLPLPTFFLRDQLPKLRLLHGSCRLLHGLGEDAFLAADEVIDTLAHSLVDRPSAMFLTGDQIYGDDVAGPLIRHLGTFGAWLVDDHDETSVPGLPPLGALPVFGRGSMMLERAGFTSASPQNHLASIGELVAMYLVALEPSNWPETFPSVDDVVRGPVDGYKPEKLRKLYDHQVTQLEAARRGLPVARRVLANVPTYMIFDDHDVTDDWNLSQEWREGVWASPSGRRIVTNALVTYWAFQAWGNDPDTFDDAFKQAIAAYAAGAADGDDAHDVDDLLWNFGRWSYVAPTTPPTIVLDTRTRRDYDAPAAAARLIGRDERERVRELVSGVHKGGDDPLVMVSPVPVFGLELQERREKFLAGKVGPYEIDFEGWHSNLRGLVDFMTLLVEDLGIERCVLLSGDVHYGINTHTTFEVGGRSAAFAQLVSSSFKHSGRLSKVAIEMLGQAVKKTHERLGWNSPPDVTSEPGMWDRMLGRMVNTDEWADDAPVFLAPRVVDQMKSTTTPRFHETRYYVRPEEPGASYLIGENNVGLVTLDSDDSVEHRLLSHDGQRLRSRTAHVELRN